MRTNSAVTTSHLRRHLGTLAVLAGALALGSLPLLFAPGVSATDASPDGELVTMTVADLLALMQQEAAGATRALPEGEIKILKAVVMKAEGSSQWKKGRDEGSWKNSVVDDTLDPGALIRTGRESLLALRVGQNASILVDRNTRMELPQVVQTGSTLSTTVSLSRGRADFKIDEVGLTNDFSVVTPSATLAVRGTGYVVAYGGLEGTRTFLARRDLLHAVEIRYFTTRFRYLLEARSKSSDTYQDPAVFALFDTVGPPPLSGTLIADDATLSLLADSFLREAIAPDPFIRNPLFDLRRIDVADQNHLDLESRGQFR